MKKYYWLLFSLFIVHGISTAQLSTNSNVTASFLVQNTLLGGGVTATNISFNGDVDAIGSFIGTNCNIGLNGIMAPNGVYLWKILLIGYDGEEYGKTGHVSLIR